MLTRIKKMLGFGELVDEARKGNLSRRGFLQAAVALGVGAEEAHGAIHKRVYSAPKLGTMPAVTVEGNPWFYRWEGLGDLAGVLGVMSVVKEGDKWRCEWNAEPVPAGSHDGRGIVEAVARKVTKYHHPLGGFIEMIAETPMVKP